MKFGQLIAYNMRNIFLKTHIKTVAGKLVPILFMKNTFEENCMILKKTISYVILS